MDFSSSLYLNPKRKRFFESIQKGTEARRDKQRLQNMQELAERKRRKKLEMELSRERDQSVRSAQRRRKKEKKKAINRIQAEIKKKKQRAQKKCFRKKRCGKKTTTNSNEKSRETRKRGRHAHGRPQLRDDGPTNPNCRDSPDPDHPARRTSMTKA